MWNTRGPIGAQRNIDKAVHLTFVRSFSSSPSFSSSHLQPSGREGMTLSSLFGWNDMSLWSPTPSISPLPSSSSSSSYPPPNIDPPHVDSSNSSPWRSEEDSPPAPAFQFLDPVMDADGGRLGTTPSAETDVVPYDTNPEMEWIYYVPRKDVVSDDQFDAMSRSVNSRPNST